MIEFEQNVKEICFSQDTAERKRFFEAASFAHPAKMILGLQIYLIEHYTKPGDVVLDPMAGSGTILVTCALERNVVAIELEQKFVDMQKANWEKIKALGPMLGHKMGEAVILQGDARNLDNVLANCAIFSPPYAEAQTGGGIAQKGYQGPKHSPTDLIGKRSYMPEQAGESDGQIANLPYGKISAVISSPPYCLGEGIGHSEKTPSKLRKEKYRSCTYTDKVDVVCTSPPYEGSIKKGDGVMGENDDYWAGVDRKTRLAKRKTGEYAYSGDNSNIGNLKSENYLQAMLLVYQGCFRVLKPKGLMILVVKNFIRDKKIICLDSDTIKLCEQAGFTLIERLKRKLTQQSFWRRIYMQKYPDAPRINFEDILIFRRPD